MYHYYKYFDDYGDFDGWRYFEVDDAGCSWREITTDGENFVGSNVFRFAMSDTCFDGYDEEEDVFKITYAEFEEVWEKHLSLRQVVWNTIRDSNPVGKQLTGWGEMWSPQGLLVVFDQNTYGVVHVAAILRHPHNPSSNPRRRLRATVSGYDEQNQWLVLAQPEVLPGEYPGWGWQLNEQQPIV